MNSDVFQGKWNQFKGDIKRQWGKLTDDDIERVAGNREELVGRIQEAYGKNRREAEMEVDDFFDQLTR